MPRDLSRVLTGPQQSTSSSKATDIDKIKSLMGPTDQMLKRVSGADSLDIDKYKMAVALASAQDYTDDDALRLAIDTEYEKLNPQYFKTGKELRDYKLGGQLVNPENNWLKNGLDSFNSAIGTGLDWGVDRFGDAVEFMTGNKEWGENIRNSTTGQDLAWIPEVAEMVGASMIPIPGVNIAAAGALGLLSESDNLSKAVSGYDPVTLEELSDKERFGSGLATAFGTGLAAVPGVGASKAAGKKLYSEALEDIESKALKAAEGDITAARDGVIKAEALKAPDRVAAATARDEARKGFTQGNKTVEQAKEALAQTNRTLEQISGAREVPAMAAASEKLAAESERLGKYAADYEHYKSVARKELNKARKAITENPSDEIKAAMDSAEQEIRSGIRAGAEESLSGMRRAAYGMNPFADNFTLVKSGARNVRDFVPSKYRSVFGEEADMSKPLLERLTGQTAGERAAARAGIRKLRGRDVDTLKKGTRKRLSKNAEGEISDETVMNEVRSSLETTVKKRFMSRTGQEPTPEQVRAIVDRVLARSERNPNPLTMKSRAGYGGLMLGNLAAHEMANGAESFPDSIERYGQGVLKGDMKTILPLIMAIGPGPRKAIGRRAPSLGETKGTNFPYYATKNLLLANGIQGTNDGSVTLSPDDIKLFQSLGGYTGKYKAAQQSDEDMAEEQ